MLIERRYNENHKNLVNPAVLLFCWVPDSIRSVQFAPEAVNFRGMAENQIEPAATTRSPRRVRYLIDIVVLIALVFGLEAAAEAAYTPKSMQASFVYGGAVQMLELVVAWVLIRLRGETLADIGLRRPGSWSRTFIVSILLAALIFAGIYFSEKAGFHRDLTRFAALQGNLGLTVYTVFYVVIGAGFYEEFMFRGFIMQGEPWRVGGGFNHSRRSLRRLTRLSKSARHVDHRHAGRLTRHSRHRVRRQSLDGNHHPCLVRCESLGSILFPRSADRLSDCRSNNAAQK